MSIRLKHAFLLWVFVSLCSAGERESLGQRWTSVVLGEVPHQRALGLYGGLSYDWTDFGFGLLSVQHLYDYEDIWLHPAPEELAVRFEGTFGAATGSSFSGARFMTSGGFLAVYEFNAADPKPCHFYAEAGIGMIYTDFQRPGQGLRFNFNPVAGIGWRWDRSFITLRLHHISNGGLHQDNRGINSVVLGAGRYLKSR